MATDFHAIPRDVWRQFVEGGGLDRVEPMRFFKPLTTIRLDPATAQEDVDVQRQRFKRLIVELFPLDRVEEFIATLLEAKTFPGIGTFDLNAGIKWPLQNAIASETKPVQAPFDLEAERMGPHGKPRLDASEFRYAVALLQLRPGLALSILFLRRLLVIWAHALRDASRGSLSAEDAPTFDYFLNSWNQVSLIKVLYPSIGLHLRPRIELNEKRIDEPAFTRPLMSEVMSWLTVQGFFARHATVESYGYDARLSCAATGIVNHTLGKRYWLNMIFDKVVEYQSTPLISRYLDRVVVRGNRLAAYADGTRAPGFSEWSGPLRINEQSNRIF